MARITSRAEHEIRRDSIRTREVRRLAPKPSVAEESCTLGNMWIDFRSAQVTRDSIPVVFSAREELLTGVWGFDAMTFTGTEDVHVAWLRQEIGENPKHQPPKGGGLRCD